MVVVIAATEERVDRKFTPAEIRDGTFATFIRDEDFDVLNRVSVLSPLLTVLNELSGTGERSNKNSVLSLQKTTKLELLSSREGF